MEWLIVGILFVLCLSLVALNMREVPPPEPEPAPGPAANWRGATPGRHAVVLEIVDPDWEPDHNGVEFWHLLSGAVLRARPVRAAPWATERTWQVGDRVQAQWIDRTGYARSAHVAIRPAV